MTEEDWLACGDQAAMLELLRGRTSPRKLRLAAVACCHGFWTADLDPRLEKAFQVAHQYADQLVSDQERDAAFREARVAGQARYSQLRRTELHEVAIRDTQYRFSLLVGFAVGGRAGDLQTHIDAPGSELLRALPAIIREVFGNPFRPVTFSPEWRTPTSVALARQMYESREFSAMPILADALQDAGCDSEDILTHCRDPRLTHVRGCWVVDLVLGKT